jgi:hypothetical protein
MTDANELTGQKTQEFGRNEPCPCGSGKKYKRCHGIGAAPKLTTPKLDWSAPAGGVSKNPMAGNPFAEQMAGMDQEWLKNFSQSLQRLPKGQMQRLQAIMQKAMAGKDVTSEAAAFEGTLPVEMQEMMKNFKMPEGMPGADALPAAALDAPSMSEEQARAIVQKAAEEGTLSTEQAEALLEGQTDATDAEQTPKSGFSKLWKGIKGK